MDAILWIQSFSPYLQAVLVEDSDASDDDSSIQRRRHPVTTTTTDGETSPDGAALRHRLEDAQLDSGESGDEEAEADEGVLAVRRQRLREKAMTKIHLEEEVTQQFIFFFINFI